MHARYKLQAESLANLPLTIEMTATVDEWRSLVEALEAAETARENIGLHPDPLRPVRHCIVNLLQAFEDATGHGRKTRGYSFAYETEEEDPR